jgi:hypothetical protein
VKLVASQTTEQWVGGLTVKKVNLHSGYHSSNSIDRETNISWVSGNGKADGVDTSWVEQLNRVKLYNLLQKAVRI